VSGEGEGGARVRVRVRVGVRVTVRVPTRIEGGWQVRRRPWEVLEKGHGKVRGTGQAFTGVG
jgi:hypothetical protein